MKQLYKGYDVMRNNDEIKRQKSLFDDGISDEEYFNIELKKQRKQYRKALELEWDKYNHDNYYTKSIAEREYGFAGVYGEITKQLTNKIMNKNFNIKINNYNFNDGYYSENFNAQIILNNEQKKVFYIMENSHESIFICGKAGAGKSEVLKYFIKNTKKEILVTAFTGVAALNIGGQTLHSLFLLENGIQRLDDEKNYNLPIKIKKLLQSVDTIVVDEASMISSDIIEMIDRKCKNALGNGLPFGGIQFIFFGDLYQLPPIVDYKTRNYLKKNLGGVFFFNAPIIRSMNIRTFELENIFRQKDYEFKNLLNDIRVGHNDIYILNKINERVLPAPTDGEIITLCARREPVNKINKIKLNEIDNKEFVYYGEIKGKVKENSLPVDKELHLKVGAQIMMVVNENKSGNWVNGSLGVITELFDNAIKVKIDGKEHLVNQNLWSYEDYGIDEETGKITKKVVGSFEQFPIKLAWAVTIHKSQGKTYKSVVIDLDEGAFSPGQVYVGLSRCTSLEGIYLKRPIRREEICVSNEVIDFVDSIQTIKLN